MNTKLDYLYTMYYQRVFRIPKLNSFTFSVKLFELFEFSRRIFENLIIPKSNTILFTVNRLGFNKQLS